MCIGLDMNHDILIKTVQNFNIDYTTHLINTSIGRPSIANVDLAIDYFTLWLLEEEGVEVVLHRGKIYNGVKIRSHELFSM